jgi:hypothetical protein
MPNTIYEEGVEVKQRRIRKTLSNCEVLFILKTDRLIRFKFNCEDDEDEEEEKKKPTETEIEKV